MTVFFSGSRPSNSAPFAYLAGVIPPERLPDPPIPGCRAPAKAQRHALSVPFPRASGAPRFPAAAAARPTIATLTFQREEI